MSATKFHRSSLHSKSNKRAQQRENERKRSAELASGSSDGESGVSPPTPPPPPGEQPMPKSDPFRESKGVGVLDPLKESKGVDILDLFRESKGVNVMDPLEKSKEVDVVVHAQKVLGKVQSSKRDMEMQSELEEAEQAFGDFVQALGSANEDG